MIANICTKVRALFVREEVAPTEILTLSYDKVSWGMYQTRNDS
jgi:hypothetical protein